MVVHCNNLNCKLDILQNKQQDKNSNHFSINQGGLARQGAKPPGT